jgi:hypothetical protein
MCVLFKKVKNQDLISILSRGPVFSYSVQALLFLIPSSIFFLTKYMYVLYVCNNVW